ncbi:MAG: CREG family protein [Gammaproteobacteria bacterium]|nr:CREG family protein [Gammaproteobacteria bacterium]
MDVVHEAQLARLVFANRWAALATFNGGIPHSSYVAYVPDGEGALLVHISRLAKHTTNLLKNPQASLSISEPDTGGEDPQTLARVSLQAGVTVIEREADAYQTARDQYVQALPDAQQLFSFADFVLFKFRIEEVRFVAGFGASFTLSAATLWRVGVENSVFS